MNVLAKLTKRTVDAISADRCPLIIYDTDLKGFGTKSFVSGINKQLASAVALSVAPLWPTQRFEIPFNRTHRVAAANS
jgi:hypothetical protein